MQNALQKYELTFILDERAGEPEARIKADQYKAYIEAHGGTVTGEELWGRRELAYPIKKNRSGFYTTFFFDFPGTEITAFEQEMQFDVAIIRSLITKAYTTAEPASLAPVVEEEAPENGRRPRGEEKASAEEMLRRSSGSSKSADASEEVVEDEETLPEEERLKQLDETLEEILKDDATA